MPCSGNEHGLLEETKDASVAGGTWEVGHELRFVNKIGSHRRILSRRVMSNVYFPPSSLSWEENGWKWGKWVTKMITDRTLWQWSQLRHQGLGPELVQERNEEQRLRIYVGDKTWQWTTIWEMREKDPEIIPQCLASLAGWMTVPFLRWRKTKEEQVWGKIKCFVLI